MASAPSVRRSSSLSPKGKDESSSWWVSSSRKQAETAEMKIIEAFLDEKKYDFQVKDVSINFDSRSKSFIEQERIKEEKRKARSSMSLANLFGFNWSNNENNENNENSENSENNENNDDFNHKPKGKPKTKSKSMSTLTTTMNNNNNNNSQIETEFIHTITVIPKIPYWNELLQKYNKNVNKEEKEEKEERKDELYDIVVTHGYGCGIGIFIPTIDKFFETFAKQLNNYYLTKYKNNCLPRVHFIDSLGCGLSSKPKFLCKDDKETEVWFVESLEEWRKSMNLVKFILAGHSLGGYMSSVYAIKYPQNIDHLILLSPVGFPDPPADYGDLSKYKFGTRLLFGTLRTLWDSGYTPYDILKYAGPQGKRFIQGYVNRKFPILAKNSADIAEKYKPLFSEYIYQINSHTDGSGLYALNKVLMPGAYAYNPLKKRIIVLKKHQVKIKSGYQILSDKYELKYEESNNKNINCKNDNLKIDFVYGQFDWMSNTAAIELRDTNQIKCKIHQLKNAGHQLIVENPVEFGKVLATIITDGKNNDLINLNLL